MADKQLELSDLIDFYPSSNDPNIQSILTSKKEFSELSSIRNERVPEVQGELFNHQRFFGRFMRAYDRGLVIDKPGTGKTCKVVTAMEWFQKNRGIVRNFFVIVPNKAVKNDVKKQIICRCDTGDRYKLPGLIEAKTLAGQRNSASKGLAKYYKVFTHGEFARFIIKRYPDEYHIRKNMIITYTGEGEEDKNKLTGLGRKVYDDYLETILAGGKENPNKRSGKEKPLSGTSLENFIINKVNTYPDKYKLKETDAQIKKMEEENYKLMVEEMSGSFYYIDEVHMLTLSEENTKQDVTKQKQKQNYYNQFYRLLHAVKRSKIVLTSATPMVNQPSDIRPIINLIRDNNELLPENFDYINSPLQEVNRYFGGYVTYVAPIDNKIDVRYQGIDILHSINLEYGQIYQDNIRVVPLEMEPFQGSIYADKYKTEYMESFKNNSLQASVFAFPDGSIGSKGFTKYINKPKVEKYAGESDEDFKKRKRQTVNRFIPRNTDGFSSLITNIDSIKSLSIKCHRIIMDTFEDEKSENPGVIYVNIPYVEGGAIPFALCFEGLGFEIFDRRESVFETINATSSNKLRPYCPPREGSGVIRRVKKEFGKRLRVGIYSSEKVFSNTVNESLLEIVNSEENANGEYVKVIIITPVGKVGISINNVSKTYTVTSDWNETNNIQKEYRSIRATSGQARIKRMQQKIINEANRTGNMVSQYELDAVRDNLNIYRLAAVVPPNIQNVLSADLDMYLMTKMKEIGIQIFFRKLMQISVDCALNKNRNQMLNYEDGSVECNYQSCQYVCYGEHPGVTWATDYTTYDIYYLGEVLESIIDKVIPIIRNSGVIDYDKLFKEPSLSNITQKHIIIAISELISNKRGIKDRFGFTVYISESDGFIYMKREYPQENNGEYSLNYYGKNMINVESIDIETTISKLEAKTQDVVEFLIGLMKSLLEKDGQITKPFYSQLDSYSLNIRANILEESLYNWYNGSNGDFNNVIMNYYEGKWYRVKEPIQQIEDQITKEIGKSNRGRPRTRKIKKFRVNRITSTIELQENEDDEEVLFHILYTYKEEQTQHGKIARLLKAEGRYRLYKPSEMIGWRDMDKYELVAYNIYVQNERQEKEISMKDNLINENRLPIYGRIQGNAFYIVDKTKENPSKTNHYTGKNCTSWSKHELVPILYELGVPLPETPSFFDVPSGIQHIKENWRKMKIKYTNMEEVVNWSEQKIYFYSSWLLLADRPNKTYTKPGFYCPLIKQAMIEQDRILTF